MNLIQIKCALVDFLEDYGVTNPVQFEAVEVGNWGLHLVCQWEDIIIDYSIEDIREVTEEKLYEGWGAILEMQETYN